MQRTAHDDVCSTFPPKILVPEGALEQSERGGDKHVRLGATRVPQREVRMQGVHKTQAHVVHKAVEMDLDKMATHSSDAAMHAARMARAAAEYASLRAAEARDFVSLTHRRALHAAASAASAACAAATDAATRAVAAENFAHAMQRVICVVRASSHFPRQLAHAHARARASKRIRSNRIQPMRHHN